MSIPPPPSNWIGMIIEQDRSLFGSIVVIYSERFGFYLIWYPLTILILIRFSKDINIIQDQIQCLWKSVFVNEKIFFEKNKHNKVKFKICLRILAGRILLPCPVLSFHLQGRAGQDSPVLMAISGRDSRTGCRRSRETYDLQTNFKRTETWRNILDWKNHQKIISMR